MNQRTDIEIPADRFEVLYRVTPRQSQSIEDVAREIAVEQTVEIPHDCIPKEHHQRGIPGKIEGIRANPSGSYDVRISFRCDLTGFAVPQLLNVLFGNISLKDNICINGISLPPILAGRFPGPNYGVEGLRNLTGVYGRPLACTALKPLGLEVSRLADMAHAFAQGGADIIKDDHGLSDQHFHPFEQRIARCQEAVMRANARSGRTCLYFPMVSGRIDEIESQVRFAVREGVRGILMAPMLVGLDTVRHLGAQYGLVIMAHPALTGTFFHDRTHGVSPAMLLGILFRLIGADISVFPNSGGRFHFTHTECTDIAAALRSGDYPWKTAFPCPAGGMPLSRIESLASDYGPDTVLLIGGALLQHGSDLTGNTRMFVDRLSACFPERLVAPGIAVATSCEWRPSRETAVPSGFLKFEEFRWSGRTAESYQSGGPGAFRGIVRQELVGRNGESTRFDLRYFEIAPGGYSGREKHVHEHVVIGVRGQGVLCRETGETSIGRNDIAYISPMEIHQLRNTGSEPFGFFCIVDHERDRPIPAEENSQF